MAVNEPNIRNSIIEILHSLGLNDLIFFDEKGSVTNDSSPERIFVNDLNIIIHLDGDLVRLILPENISENQVMKLMKKLSSVPGINIRTDRLNHQINPKTIKLGEASMNSTSHSRTLSEANGSDRLERMIQLLKTLYSYTGSGIEDSDNIKSVKDSEWVRQATRLINGIGLKPGSTVSSDQIKAYSPDQSVRRLQILYRYYATLSERLDPVKDTILANISSRVADHYMFKLMNVKTVMNEYDPLFKKVIQLLNLVGKRGGFNPEEFVRKEMKKTGTGIEKEVVEESDHGGEFMVLKKNLKNWFENFKIENIFK